MFTIKSMKKIVLIACITAIGFVSCTKVKEKSQDQENYLSGSSYIKQSVTKDLTNDYEYGECDDVEEYLDETDYDENHVGSYYNETSVNVGDENYSVNFHDNPDGSIGMDDNEGYSVSGYSDGNGVYVTDNEGRSEYIGF